ncbi:peptide MFS transporter [Yersinia mollaretii]|uniref:Di-and tri-peptide transporter n=1 Tax=Yersinia mollaretii (strain ATCC 43969 / DSM 18520 / CIP 103324 / CNY 7263 / WAIP 204) TaxID=349967 RepID=A0ABM9YDE8_YERMW|nr:peptide MFS transporter [Yersinia mollaretii]EEQ11952.1 Di-and tri-peptide transporter [Yersinia mollaretii ATCC 43969]MDN0110076.1 peptide MFS transporter [Yersinia mollaretii]PJE86050.1 MFS transporter [Yersinia mollaretii]QKJ04629.1 peptide MFS transporter [Yersinia mollaretii ATCC 43969]CQD33752.1 proton dependent peptide transporter [Yersinia mollaretii]
MQTSINSSGGRTFFGHPYPLSGLFLSEMWERFSFYGIRPLLILFMAATVFDGGMGLPREQASAIVGIFAGSMYLAALPGGWLADNWLGQQRAVWYGSILIALGHLSIALSAFFGNDLFFIGLVFIVLGTGLFKTCISVMVGTLYKPGDARRDGGFSLFYMGINMGSFIAPLLSGWLLKTHGWHWGFGIGGIGMLVALLIFRYIAIPSMKRYDAEVGLDSSWNRPTNKRQGVGKWVAAIMVLVVAIIALISNGIIPINPVLVASLLVYLIAASVTLYFVYLFAFAKLSRKDRARLLVCFILLVSAAFFWSAFEQKPTSFNLFANDYTNRNLMGFEIPTVWFQSINALFIIILAPVFSWAWPALAKKKIQPSSITKFVIGILCAAAGFAVMMYAAQHVLNSGGEGVSPLWLVMSILLLTLGELCLSPIGLATMTLLAPERMRGQVMGLWFCASSLGNLAAGLIGGHVKADQLDMLPTLFARCSIALVICAAVLILLIVPIRRMMNNTQGQQAA